MGNDLINNGRMKNKLPDINTIETNDRNLNNELVIPVNNIFQKEKEGNDVNNSIENYDSQKHLNKNKLKDTLMDKRINPFFYDDKKENKEKEIKIQKATAKSMNNTDEVTRIDDHQSSFAKQVQKKKILVIKENMPGSQGQKAESIDSSEDNDSGLEYPYKVCFICDNYRESNQVFYCYCHHYFCWKCGKKFYETKIEKQDYSFTCPMFKCQNLIKIQMLMKIISDKHYELLLRNQVDGPKGENNLEPTSLQKILNSESNQENENNAIKSNKGIKDSKENILDIGTCSKKSEKKDDKVILAKNMIKLDNYDNDLMCKYQKNKERYCHNCGEPGLFEIRKHVIKCLNCFQVMCKFCMKHYHSDHFDLTSFNYCKVYFRSRLCINEVTSNSKIKEFFLNIIIILISYLFFILGNLTYIQIWLEEKINPFNKNKLDENKEFNESQAITISIEKNKVYKNNKNHNKDIDKNPHSTKVCLIICYYIVMIIVLSISIVFLLLLIPFFPILVTLFK